MGLAGKNEKKKKNITEKKTTKKKGKNPVLPLPLGPSPTPPPEATHDPASSERLQTTQRKRAAREGGARGGGERAAGRWRLAPTSEQCLSPRVLVFLPLVPKYLTTVPLEKCGFGLRLAKATPTQPPSVGTRVYLKSVASRRRRSMCVALNLNGPSACTRLLKSASGSF